MSTRHKSLPILAVVLTLLASLGFTPPVLADSPLGEYSFTTRGTITYRGQEYPFSDRGTVDASRTEVLIMSEGVDGFIKVLDLRLDEPLSDRARVQRRVARGRITIIDSSGRQTTGRGKAKLTIKRTSRGYKVTGSYRAKATSGQYSGAKVRGKVKGRKR